MILHPGYLKLLPRRLSKITQRKAVLFLAELINIQRKNLQ
ncbi:hypothetical protein SAMN02799624_04517 [Paenibacillus sp. UNC496MF]|nr:hypothetical protein SAMN02799624_04517 [Paenibacillus sp. UNC496MF]